MGKRVAIVQSSYIPWKGLFDMIAGVDEFVFLDDVQYTKRDWRNRNRIKTAQGLLWLSIPVTVTTRSQRIDETRVADPGWADAHWRTVAQSYARAPHFETYRSLFAELYLGCEELGLSAINERFLRAICAVLGIETTLSRSTDYGQPGADKGKRLIEICLAAGADEYLSGPAARDYLVEERFAERGVEVSWMDYGGYPQYAQLYPPFEHRVSVIDLLFNTGPDARNFMKGFSDSPADS